MVPGAGLQAIDGGTGAVTDVSLAGTDAVTHIGLVRVPEAPARPVAPIPLAALRRPLWVVAVEGTQAGYTLRPVQLGRGEAFVSPRWPNPLLPLGATTVAPGALVFSVSGDFVGMVVIDKGALAIADARDVVDVATRLGAGAQPAPAGLGVALQPLTPELSLATRAPRGVVVAEVDAEGPAAGLLRPGDVVTALNDQAVEDPDRFLLAVAALPREAVRLTVVRGGTPQTIEMTPAPAVPAGPVAAQVGFERAPGTGTRVVEDPSDRGLTSPALLPGDVVVAVGDEPDPTPVQIRRLLAAAAPDAGIVFTLRRDGRQFVVVVHPPARRDVP